jgi:hypothetical protein
MIVKWKLIGCPQCYRDDEPWFFKTKDGLAHQQTCNQCGHVFRYTAEDVWTDRGKACDPGEQP